MFKKIKWGNLLSEKTTMVLITMVGLFFLLPANLMAQDNFQDVAAKNGKTYRIFIAVPDGNPPKLGWPAIYLLDGNSTFPLAKAMNPDAILIGIGYPTHDQKEIIQNRYYDLTVEAQPDKIPLRPNMPTPKTGGEAEFRDFLNNTLMQEMHEKLNIDTTRITLFGHSLGGLFVLRSLLEDNSPFSFLCSADPSIWWNSHSFIDELPTFNETSAPSIFIATAGKKAENHNINQEQQEKVKALRAGPNGSDVAKILQAQKGVSVSYQHFAQETHGSLIEPALTKCISLTITQKKHASYNSSNYEENN